MLTDYGVPALRRLRAHVHRLSDYLDRWEAFLLDLPYRDWPTSSAPSKETR